MRRFAGCAGVLAMCLAGCGSAEDAGPVLADAPGLELQQTADKEDTADPYGLEAASKSGASNLRLEACAADPDCPEYPEAQFQSNILSATHKLDGFSKSNSLKDIADRMRPVEMALDLDRLHALPVESHAFAMAKACLRSGKDCGDTVLAEQSKRGDFNEYRTLRREFEDRINTSNENVESTKLEMVRAAREGAALGSRSANAMMGMLYAHHHNMIGSHLAVDRNDVIAVDYLIAAADGGSPGGAYALAQMINVGRAGPTHDVNRLLRVAYEGGLQEPGIILLQRQRERGKVDPELEAALTYDQPYMEYAARWWNVHPDKPESYEVLYKGGKPTE